VHGEQAAKIGTVNGWKMCPVLDVVGKVVHAYGVRVQRVAEADDKGMAALWRGIE
jgi:hypothetical protein